MKFVIDVLDNEEVRAMTNDRLVHDLQMIMNDMFIPDAIKVLGVFHEEKGDVE